MKPIFLAALISLAVALLAAAPNHALAEENHPCFSVVDADGNGEATFDEFKNIYGPDSAEKFKALDKDGDGTVSHPEYEAGVE